MQEILCAIQNLKAKNRPAIIAISGFGGSGKSTLAAALKGQLRGAQVITVDDFAVGRAHERSADWSCYDRQRLQKQVLEPAQQGKPICYQAYDWQHDRLGEWRAVPSSTYLIIEGVGILHPDLLRYYDFKIWVDCRLKTATQRGMKRDRQLGNNHDNLWLNIWAPNDRDFMAKHRPNTVADSIYDTN